jgi:hypothetical protein
MRATDEQIDKYTASYRPSTDGLTRFFSSNGLKEHADREITENDLYCLAQYIRSISINYDSLPCELCTENSDVCKITGEPTSMLKICAELGLTDYPKVIRAGMTDAEKRTHARKLNMARRHLTQEQRRGLTSDGAARNW